MQRVRGITTWECDVCGKECEPIRRIKIPVCAATRDPDTDPVGSFVFVVASAKDRGRNTCGDVCESCLEMLLQRYLEASGDLRLQWEQRDVRQEEEISW